MCEIRGDYDRTSIVVYQAYRPEIAQPAIENGRFVPPFSRSRMTWIKPSFLWLMERSNWASKPGQEMVLAVRITREGWEAALSQAVLTHADHRLYRSSEDWRAQFARARVHVQWDPERTLRGKKLDQRSIQVGLSRHIVDHYVDAWTVDIQDLTPLVRRIHRLLTDGNASQAKKLLPPERPYLVNSEIAMRIGAGI